MNPIDQAILQEEIRNALNALFVNGQVGRSNKVVLEWNDKKTYETMETADERGTVAKVSNTAIDPATVKSVCFVAKDTTTGAILAEEIAGADMLTTAPCNAGGTLVVSTAGATLLWIVTAEDVENVPNGDAIIGTWFCNASNNETSVSVTMTAVIETIHPIDPKFLPGVTLNLCDYGINIYELIQKGTSGYFVMDTALAQKLNEKIPTDGSRVVLVTDDGVNPILHDQSALIACTRDGGAGAISSFCATAYPSMNAVLYIDVHVAFTFNTESGAVDATRVYYNCSTKSLPTTEVS